MPGGIGRRFSPVGGTGFGQDVAHVADHGVGADH